MDLIRREALTERKMRMAVINLTDMDKKEIITVADCNMNISRAAKLLYCHRNSLVYHLQSIRTRTGLDPWRFRDLATLVRIAESDTGEDE